MHVQHGARVITAEAAGLIRFRKPGERVVPESGIPACGTWADVICGFARRKRRRILRDWAIAKGYIRPLDPPEYRRRQLSEVIENFSRSPD